MYRNIKQLTNKPTHRLNVLKDEDGNILTEEEEIKARWKQYCENLCASKEENTSEDNDLTSEHNVDEPDILMCEMEQAIKRLRNGKSPGIDNIQAELLKESDSEGIKSSTDFAIRFGEAKNGRKIGKGQCFYLYQRKEIQGSVLTTVPYHSFLTQVRYCSTSLQKEFGNILKMSYHQSKQDLGREEELEIKLEI